MAYTYDDTYRNEESVWDYPRPPLLVPSAQHIRIEHAGITIADSRRTLRVLETSHPPVYYIPQDDLRMDLLEPNQHTTFCEFKGKARYWTLHFPDDTYHDNVGWSYPEPTPNFLPLKDYLAFYPSLLDKCFVGDELVQAQAGDFYGGWITSWIKGPFKGEPGTLGW